MVTNFTVNGRAATTDAPPHTALLWVIREGLKLTGTKFGCGTGLCGVRRLYCPYRRQARLFLSDTGVGGGRQVGDDDRGPLPQFQPSVAKGVAR